MSRIVLDASVLLAILNDERGAEVFSRGLDLLESATMSSVNAAEAHANIVRSGMDPEDAWNAVTPPISEIADFAADQAKMCGALAARTGFLGLSPGDRACLALATLSMRQSTRPIEPGRDSMKVSQFTGCGRLVLSRRDERVR